MVGCDLHGVLKFSQVVGVVPWYLPLRFGRGQKYLAPRWNLKIAAILNFHVNMPPYWILCVFGPLLTKLFAPFGCITAQSKLYNSDAAYSAEETVDSILNEIAQFTDYITFIAYTTCILA